MLAPGSSRWRVFLEARDAVVAALAPALTVTTLLKAGPRIAKQLRQPGGTRTKQMSGLSGLWSP